MPKLQLKNNTNLIHPTAIIDPSASLGVGNYIGPYCIIGKGVSIGDNNRLEAYCSIGLPPEHKEYFHGGEKSVLIGNSCIIREFATVNAGTTSDTIIEDNVLILRGAYVGHDCKVQSNVTISSNAQIAGHCIICEGANLGLNVAIHQFSIIGHFSMVGMAAAVTKKSKIEPFGVYVGVPARYLKKNEIGIIKNKIDIRKINQCQEEYQHLVLKKKK